MGLRSPQQTQTGYHFHNVVTHLSSHEASAITDREAREKAINELLDSPSLIVDPPMLNNRNVKKTPFQTRAQFFKQYRLSQSPKDASVAMSRK